MSKVKFNCSLMYLVDWIRMLDLNWQVIPSAGPRYGAGPGPVRWMLQLWIAALVNRVCSSWFEWLNLSNVSLQVAGYAAQACESHLGMHQAHACVHLSPGGLNLFPSELSMFPPMSVTSAWMPRCIYFDLTSSNVQMSTVAMIVCNLQMPLQLFRDYFSSKVKLRLT